MAEACGRVLVVDDEPDIGSMLEEILELEGYAVSAAISGAQALELAGRDCYDLALVDINMPGMSGIELMKRLRKEHPAMSFIVVTAFAGDELTRLAMGESAAAVFSKPIDFHRLTASIEAIISGKG